MPIDPIRLIRQATPAQRRTLLAAAMGWALDAFDAMLYALVLTQLMRDFGMSKTTSGLLGTLTLLALWIQRRVPESDMWEEQERTRSPRRSVKLNCGEAATRNTARKDVASYV